MIEIIISLVIVWASIGFTGNLLSAVIWEKEHAAKMNNLEWIISSIYGAMSGIFVVFWTIDFIEEIYAIEDDAQDAETSDREKVDELGKF